ncbi:MAG: two-component system response regulator, partial [Longimicrobiales bacterium]
MTSPRTPAGGLSELASEELLEARILIVDDEPANLRVLERLLNRVGYGRIRTTDDPREVESLFEEFRPDLVLLDLHMPHLDGFEVMEMLDERIPSDVFLPILVLTGDPDPDTKRRALSVGAKDFVGKPFEATEALLRIKNLLETRTLHEELRAYSETLEEKVRGRTRELAEAQTEILHRLALAAEYRDDVTGRHAERVGVISALVAQVVGLSDEEVKVIRRAAPLHDVGKIGIPDAILMKPGPLTPQEFEVMKSHTTIGERILSGTAYPLLETARVIALYHHEKWDGSGYQPGRAGEDIPLVGRIVAAADAFDCLTHERPYKESESTQAAKDE